MTAWARTALISAAFAVGIPLAAFAQTETVPSVTQPATRQAQIPVKLVVLFSSGVGYFEHFGSVAGDNRTELRFKTNQINDILKSLVLQDLDGGRVTTITYPSQDPVAKTLRSFQVDITANPSLAELLNQLRGAKVTVRQQAEETRGTILGVEKKKKPVGGDSKEIVEESILNLVSETPKTRLVAIPLDGVADIRLEDPALQEELDRALAALAQSRDKDKKPVQIAFEGQGDRRVRLGYVVETPIWKTSYRLILGDKETKPRLQGWAIVENQTDNDWSNVQLSLVSGRPISFVQDLYQPLYVARPTVQPELYAGLTPRRYEEGLADAKKAEQFGVATLTATPAAPASAAPGRVARMSRAAKQTASNLGEDLMTFSADEAPIDATSSVSSIASAAKVGELFQYTVGNVSLPRQKSAMIPIVTDEIEIERLSIYNQSVLARNPLNGARMKNTTGKHLLAGPITVFDGNSYAGDAQVDTLPPSQERLISYGIDQQVTVDATKNRHDNALLTGKIVKGVLELQRKQVATQDYLLDNKSDVEKTVIIEHPLRQGWSLVETDKPIETTQTLYRFKGPVAAGKASKLTVKEQLVHGEEIAILPADLAALVVYAKTGEIPDEVKKALTKAIELRRNLATTHAQLEERKGKAKELAEQHKHTAEIMRTLQHNTPVYQRLVTKLNDLQTSIEKVQTEVDELTNSAQQQKNELENYLANLTVG